MKKLMLAAFAVATAGVFAANCTPDDPVPQTLVYKYKATVKTPKGIAKYTPATPGSVCNPGQGGTEAATNVIRAKDKTKFAGWIYDCEATCDTVANGSVVAWDSKRKSQLNDAAIASDFIHVIGKKQSDAEWSFKLTGTAVYTMGEAAYDLQHAGFGKYSAKKGYYTSFSGNFAGTVDKVTYVPKFKAATADDCVPAGYWLCADLTAVATDDAAVAYGCWSAKVSKSASKKFAKNGYLKAPKYVVVTSAAE